MVITSGTGEEVDPQLGREDVEVTGDDTSIYDKPPAMSGTGIFTGLTGFFDSIMKNPLLLMIILVVIILIVGKVF